MNHLVHVFNAEMCRVLDQKLSWFQTRLPPTALPLRCVIIACCFRVAAISGHTALTFSPSGIVLKLNRSQLSVVCCCGQSGEDID